MWTSNVKDYASGYCNKTGEKRWICNYRLCALWSGSERFSQRWLYQKFELLDTHDTDHYESSPLLSLRVPTFGVMKTSPSLLLIGFFIYSWDFTPQSFFSLNRFGLIIREFSFITLSFSLWQCWWFKVSDRTYYSWLIFQLMDTDGSGMVKKKEFDC